jgi:hypothetical protein
MKAAIDLLGVGGFLKIGAYLSFFTEAKIQLQKWE